MTYFLSATQNTHDLVTYLHDESTDYRVFNGSAPLATEALALSYSVASVAKAKRLQNAHVVTSVGPILVSHALRTVLEQQVEDSNEVSFYDAAIASPAGPLSGFSAMHVRFARPCIDMAKSEFKPTNFDPANPTYRFYYFVVDPNCLGELSIVRCAEFGVNVVVSERVLEACKGAGLHGLSFARGVDMTYGGRGVSIDI